MGFIKRLFGICRTPLLEDRAVWRLDGETLEIDVAKVRALRAKGSAVRLEGDDLPVRVLVVHGLDDGWYAYENKCTHGGRRFDPLGDEAHLECCSVGKSTFDYAGHLISGAAKENLTQFAAHKEGDMLRVELTPEPAA